MRSCSGKCGIEHPDLHGWRVRRPWKCIPWLKGSEGGGGGSGNTLGCFRYRWCSQTSNSKPWVQCGREWPESSGIPRVPWSTPACTAAKGAVRHLVPR